MEKGKNNARWELKKLSAEQEKLVKPLAKECMLSAAAARLLVARGIRNKQEASAFAHPALENLHDPFLMLGMEQAVVRLGDAIEKKERIMVYGDYDVDGTTAVALMYSFLRELTDNLVFYIPDRYKEGYGISFQGIDTAEAEGCGLIVALDCGIKSVDKVEYAKEKGIDFIICDHHTPGDEIPRAVAVLNMKQEKCGYPFKELSGCGVGFKLIQAYALRHDIDMEKVYALLPFLAMSIASDIVPVVGENRILAYYGLKKLNKAPNVGLQALINAVYGEVKASDEQSEKSSEGKKVEVSFSDLVYKIGPRINACGRMKSGKEAVDLLITEDEEMAKKMAEAINVHNETRKDSDKQTTEEALQMLRSDEKNESRCTTVVYSPTWHKGVVGIVASRLTEEYYRPTIVFTAGENGMITGSARSVSTFDIYSAIESCKDLLTNFGGHKFAAGLSMMEENLGEFKVRFEKYVAEHIEEEQKTPVVYIESEINLEEIGFGQKCGFFMNTLLALEPFGPGNPRPLFLTRGLCNNHGTRRVGKKGEHLKLDVTDGTAMISGIGFSLGERALHLQNGGSVDICYHLEINDFRNRKTIQMFAVDVREHEVGNKCE